MRLSWPKPLSCSTGRQICLTREEVFYCHRGRHPVLMKFKTGVKKDGAITGMHLQTLDRRWRVWLVRSRQHVLLPAHCKPPPTTFRAIAIKAAAPSRINRPAGPSATCTPQPRFGQEVQLDKIAEKLKIDPADLRLRIVESSNAVTANFFRLGTVILPSDSTCCQGLRLEREIPQAAEGRAWIGLLRISDRRRTPHLLEQNAAPGVQLKIRPQRRRFDFLRGDGDRQGSDDVLAGIVAEVLGIDTFDIRLFTGDTDLGPVDLGSYSSRVTLMAGNAAFEASERGKSNHCRRRSGKT